ncbi:MAG: lipocalin-like domain-containing protein [Kordiimonas sp.]
MMILSTSAKAADIIGEWQLVSAELTIGDNSFPTFDPQTHEMIKVITDSHFMFLSKGPQRPRFSSYQPTHAEKVTAFDNFGGGGGTYSLEGHNYTEHVKYSIFPNYEGMSLSFKVTITEDQLVQEGHYPIVKLGLGSRDGYVKEVYRRIR